MKYIKLYEGYIESYDKLSSKYRDIDEEVDKKFNDYYEFIKKFFDMHHDKYDQLNLGNENLSYLTKRSGGILWLYRVLSNEGQNVTGVVSSAMYNKRHHKTPQIEALKLLSEIMEAIDKKYPHLTRANKYGMFDIKNKDSE